MRNNFFAQLFLGIFVVQTCLPFAISDARADGYCDSFCGSLSKSLDGTGNWGQADANACAAYQNNSAGLPPSPSPSTSPSTSPSPWPSTQSQQLQCQYHAGQAPQQCEAYEAAKSADGFESLLVQLDTASAVLCTAACVDFGISAAACSASSVVASGAEILGVLQMKSSPISSAIDGALSAAAIGQNAGAASNAMKTGGTWKNSADPTTSSNQRKDACSTAVVMVILTVLRMKALQDNSNTENQACGAVESLTSTASLSTTSAPSNSPAALSAGGTNFSGGTQGAPGSLASGFQSPGAPGSGVACAQNGIGTQPGGCGLSPQQLSSYDGHMLNSALAPAAANQAANMNAPGLMNQLASNQNPGSILGSALDSAGGAGGAAGEAFANLAKTTAEHASELGAAGGIVMQTSKGGSGGAAGNKFGGFKFDFGGAAAATAPASDMSFAGAASQPSSSSASTDIWHTGFKGSLFDIITQKISATRNRVETLGWSTPLNRALAGSPSAPNPKP